MYVVITSIYRVGKNSQNKWLYLNLLSANNTELEKKMTVIKRFFHTTFRHSIMTTGYILLK